MLHVVNDKSRSGTSVPHGFQADIRRLPKQIADPAYMSAYAGESARESGSASQKPYAHAGHACESARHSMGKTGPFRQFLCSKQHAKNNAQYAPLFENCPPLRRSRSRKNPWVSLWITAGGRVQCPHFQPNIHIVLMFSHSVKRFAGGGHNLRAGGGIIFASFERRAACLTDAIFCASVPSSCKPASPADGWLFERKAKSLRDRCFSLRKNSALLGC